MHVQRLRLRHKLAGLLQAFRAVELVGPRQVGKTTLARDLIDIDSPNYFDLEDSLSRERLANPMTALSGLEGLVVIGRLPALFLVPSFALHGYGLSAPVLGWDAPSTGAYLVGLLLSQSALLLLSLGLLRNTATTLTPNIRSLLAGGLMGIGAARGEQQQAPQFPGLVDQVEQRYIIAQLRTVAILNHQHRNGFQQGA